MSLHKLALAQHLYTTGETGSRVQLACTLAQLRLIAASLKIQQKSQPCVRSVQSEQSEHSEVLSAFQLLHSHSALSSWTFLKSGSIWNFRINKMQLTVWQSGTQLFLCCFPKAPPTFPRSARLQDCNSFRLLLGPWAFLFFKMTKPTTDMDLSGLRTQHTNSDPFCEMLRCFIRSSGLALNGYSTLEPRLDLTNC